MKLLPLCLHCGRTNEVYRNVRAYGWSQEHFDGWGNQTSIETEGLKFTHPQTFYCFMCGKRRTDLIENKDELILIEKPPQRREG